VAHVYSNEHNAEWQRKVATDLERRGVNNVTYRLLAGNDYTAATHVADDSVDFILVDGTLRHACMQTALRKVRPGGWIYLDNADKEANDHQGDVTLAENLLLEHVRQYGRSHEYFIDLIPTYLAASKGLLAQVEK
jgi:predicted O-methyltransferase YrrM